MTDPIKFNLALCSLLAICCLSCSSGAKSDSNEVETQAIAIDNTEELLGTWRNLSMTVRYLDKDSVFEVPEGRWEEKLQIKPIITTYAEDGTYSSKYYNLADSLLLTTSGTWSLMQDSLYLTAEGKTKAYRFLKQGDIAVFTAQLDWDQDGLANELYSGRQKKGH